MRCKIFKRAILTALLAFQVATAANAQFFLDDNILKMAQIIKSIEMYYVDSADINGLTEKAIVEMLKELDPHSTYIPKKEVFEMNQNLQGEFEGVGITFNILSDTIYVISPISGGPSEKVGITAGDRIISVEGENVAGVGITSKGVRDRLLGEKGTKVKVGVKRNGVEDVIYFTITRDKIPIYSVDASYMLNDSVGYIKINRFAKSTLEEFFDAAGELRDRGMENMVLDLSGNAGGYLEVAFMLADQFLQKDKLIVYTEGDKTDRQEFNSTGEGFFKNGRLVIMIDEGSASASEIVSGAVQDWDRGVLVGRRTFGKGLVQRPVNLQDSSMIRLTVARYYTPSGRCIQKSYDKGVEDYSKDIINRYNSGELISKDSIHFPEDQKFYTLKKNRPVYAGGGIMPDIFVPLDTLGSSDWYRKLIAKGTINMFALNFVDDNRKSLKSKYKDFETFKEEFVINEKILKKLNKFAKSKDIEFVEEDYKVSKDRLNNILKAFIARDIWGTSEFYSVYNENNPIFIKAKEVISNPGNYNMRLLPPKKK